MGIKDKIKEAVISHIVEKLLVLGALLLGIVWLALKPLIAQRILPSLSKELLAGLLVVTIILLSAVSAYVFYLRKKLNPKLKYGFGVLWDKAQNMYCLKDKTRLHQSGAITGGGLGHGYPVFVCIKCDREYVLENEHKWLIDLNYAKKLMFPSSAD